MAHVDVLDQVDLAHAAGAQRLQDLVAADDEVLVSAMKELLGLERRQQPVADEAIGEELWLVGHAALGVQALEVLLEALLAEQGADTQVGQEVIGSGGGGGGETTGGGG